MFVDACAIVSILSREPDAESYAAALELVDEPITSSLAAWEAILVLSRPDKLDRTFKQAERIVCDWLSERGIAMRESLAPPAQTLSLAIHAAQTWGRSRSKLSSYDCFHYAFAKSAGVTMLTRDRALRATDLDCMPLD